MPGSYARLLPDINGDNVPDIGADQYDSPVYQDAGAIYVFPMAAVK